MLHAIFIIRVETQADNVDVVIDPPIGKSVENRNGAGRNPCRDSGGSIVDEERIIGGRSSFRNRLPEYLNLIGSAPRESN